jgi:hypothetical protein
MADVSMHLMAPREQPEAIGVVLFVLCYKIGGDPYTLQYLPGPEGMTITRVYVKLAAQDLTGTYRSLLDGDAGESSKPPITITSAAAKGSEGSAWSASGPKPG